MDWAELPGDPPVTIAIRRSGRARRYALRVSGLDGQVTLTVPPRGTHAEALAFARSRADWIRAAVANRPAPERVGFGTSLPVAGRQLPVVPGKVRAPVVAADELVVPADPDRVAARVAAFLRERARAAIVEACARHAAALGRPHGRITLRDTRSRWGSCTAAGDLMFSWRLAMAPPEVLDYVAAHEVAHLERMDHSSAFWAVVEDLCRDYRAHRQWLRRDGAALHRYRFAD